MVDTSPADEPATPEDLPRRANLAMYGAKAGPKDATVRHDPTLSEPETAAALRAGLAAALRGDLAGGIPRRPVPARRRPATPAAGLRPRDRPPYGDVAPLA
jgi:hypothetical protein